MKNMFPANFSEFVMVGLKSFRSILLQIFAPKPRFQLLDKTFSALKINTKVLNALLHLGAAATALVDVVDVVAVVAVIAVVLRY